MTAASSDGDATSISCGALLSSVHAALVVVIRLPIVVSLWCTSAAICCVCTLPIVVRCVFALLCFCSCCCWCSCASAGPSLLLLLRSPMRSRRRRFVLISMCGFVCQSNWVSITRLARVCVCVRCVCVRLRVRLCVRYSLCVRVCVCTILHIVFIAPLGFLVMDATTAFLGEHHVHKMPPSM